MSLKSGFFKGFLKNKPKNLEFGLLRFLRFFCKKAENLGFKTPFLQPCNIHYACWGRSERGSHTMSDLPQRNFVWIWNTKVDNNITKTYHKNLKRQ